MPKLREKVYFMSPQESKLKADLIKNLKDTNHFRFADRLSKFDIRIVPYEDDPNCTAFVRWGEGAIYIGQGFVDLPNMQKKQILTQLNVLIRHEISHKIFMHFLRMLKEAGVNLSKSPSFHDILNFLEDDEISNKTYSDEDKNTVHHMTQNRVIGQDPTTKELKTEAQVIGGLITEDHRQNWVNLSVEEMYEELKKEVYTLNKSLIATRYGNATVKDLDTVARASHDPLLSRVLAVGKPYQDLRVAPATFYSDMSPQGLAKDVNYQVLFYSFKKVIMGCAEYLYSFPQDERVDKAKELVKKIADTPIVDSIKIGDVSLDTPEQKQIATDYFKCAYFPNPKKGGNSKGKISNSAKRAKDSLQPRPNHSPEYEKIYNELGRIFNKKDSGGEDIFSSEELGEIISAITKEL